MESSLEEYNEIIADSSFYICFLDDINMPEMLTRLISKFDFIITPTIVKEIEISKNYKYIKGNSNIHLFSGKENMYI